MANRTANDIYLAALSLLDAQDMDNNYKDRSVAIINALMSRCWQYTEDYKGGSRSGFTAISSLDDELVGFDDTLVFGVMPYGLAAALYIGEDPLRANSWQQQFEENLFEARRIPSSIEPIEDVYGFVNPSSFARW